MFHDPDFMPFTPLKKPSVWAMRDNMLVNYPPAAYRNDWFVLRLPLIAQKINVILNPDLVDEMLVARAEEFPRDQFTKSLSGPIDSGSLFYADGSDWKWQRRAVSAAFRHDNILAQVPIFAACAREQVATWRRVEPGTPADVAPAMSRTTFKVIVRSVLGAGENFDQEKYVSELARALNNTVGRSILKFLGLPAEYIPYPGYFRARAAFRYLIGATKALIEERRASNIEQKDILQLLLSARDPETGRVMTEDELVGNLFTFLLAGHETSAIAMSWTLWLLAKDQASQQRLREEVRAVAGEDEISPANIERLAFTRQVLQESMRLFPPGAVVTRQPLQDTTLGPYEVSKRDMVAVMIWCLHRHEKLWEDPQAFDPDRFAPEKVKARHRFAYMPFGAGPRICVGMTFAMLEMTTLLASFVREFRFSTVPGHRLAIDTRFLTRPKGGVPLLIEPLQQKAVQSAA